MRSLLFGLGLVVLAAAGSASAHETTQKALRIKAIGDFDAAIELRPNFGDAYIYRGLAWVQKHDYDRASADFTDAARIEPRKAFLALMNRGNVYDNKGDNDRVLQDYSQAIRLRPDYAASYYNRGNIYYASEEFEKAIADFDAAVRLNPAYADSYTNRAAAYLAKDETDTAIANFNEAVRLHPGDAILFGNRGSAYVAKGDYERALADFDEAVRLQPDNARGYASRGIARFYYGRHDAAVEDFARAVRLRPTDAVMVIWLHSVRARAGQDDLQELTKSAVSVDRTRWPGPLIDLHLGLVSPDILRAAALPAEYAKARRTRTCELNFHLGTFHLEQGRREEARRALQAAAESCLPGAIERAAARAELAALDLKQ